MSCPFSCGLTSTFWLKVNTANLVHGINPKVTGKSHFINHTNATILNGSGTFPPAIKRSAAHFRCLQLGEKRRHTAIPATSYTFP